MCEEEVIRASPAFTCVYFQHKKGDRGSEKH